MKKSIIIILGSLLIIGHFGLKSFMETKIMNYDFSIFDNIKNFQNNFFSLFYKPSGKIPVHKFEISPSNLEELYKNPDPQFQDYVKGTWLRPNGEKEKVKFRFRGGSEWHWINPKKSWRVKTDNPLANRSIFNFINPRHKSHLIYPLEFFLGEKAGLKSPRHQFVSLYINEKYQGLYSEIEQIENVAVFNGEPPFSQGENIDLMKDSKYGVFDDINYWDISNSNPETNKKFEEFLTIIQNGLNPQYKAKIDTYLDIDKTLRYIAIQNLLASKHIDNFHNFKLFYNENSGKFEPIAWDIVDWLNFDPETRINFTNNTLFNQLLSYPDLMEKKNKYLWDFSNTFASNDKIQNFIDSQKNLIKTEILFDPIKDFVDNATPNRSIRPLSYSDWQNAISLLKDWYLIRNSFIIEEMKSTNIGLYLLKSENLLFIDVESNANWTLIKNEVETGYKVYPETKILYMKDEFGRTNESIEILGKRFAYNIKNKNSTFKIKNTITGEIIEPYINVINSIDELPSLEQ